MSKSPKNKNTKTTIYTINHPVTGEIRYVGKTCRSIKSRLTQHIWDANNRPTTHKHMFIRSLLESNLLPIIKPVVICQWNESEQLEIGLIKILKEAGCNLTNHTKGGEGTLGFKRSEDSNNKSSTSLRKVIGIEVHQYNLNGDYIASYNTIVEASYATSCLSSKIVAVCKGKRSQTGNYQWRYYKTDSIDKYKGRNFHRKGVKLSLEHRNIAIRNLKHFNSNWIK